MNEHLSDPAFRFRKKELRGPDPVGAKAMRTLRLIAQNELLAFDAPTQVERLRRSGYVVVDDAAVAITDAGRALLGQQPSDGTK